MNKCGFLVVLSIALLEGSWAVAGGIRAREMVRFPSLAAHRSGIRALIKQPRVMPLTSTSVLRNTLAVARKNFQGPHSLLQHTSHSVVQISMPNHSSVLGTGFVLKARGRLWVAMPFHLGGIAGRSRVVRLRKLDGSIAEQEVVIAINGTAGWHAPDISLAQLPEQWYDEVEPLEIAPVDPKQNIYSVGYVAGKLKMGEVLPVASQLIHVDRQGILREFHVPGSTLENPVSGNGYCGSALLQQIDGKWKVVGMHNGHVMDLENPAASVGSSVNLATTVPQLIDNYFSPMAMKRGLVFRGWEIERLSPLERVDVIAVYPADKPTQEPVVRYMRNFAAPYLDAHVEQALGDLNLKHGDKLVFFIVGHSETQHRMSRQVEFIIP